jgi:acetylornithine deacetylase/succinyl-diaminopimelate desuccinylase-like protein
MKESEVAAIFEGFVHATGIGFKGKVEMARAFTLVWSGKGIRTFTATGDRPVQEHEPTLFEIWVCVDGYWNDLTKNLCPGELTPEYHKLLDLLLVVFNEAAAFAKDGASLPELDRLIRARIAEGGYPGQPSHAVCHGVGARAHEPPYAHQAGTGTIRKGMVLAIEPGIYWPGGGGLRLEDNFWITGDGNEKLCSFPDDFRVLNAACAGKAAADGDLRQRCLADNVMKQAVLSRIREDEIVSMCCDVVNISSPTGGELAMAEYMRAAFQRLGLTITWQPVEDGRANVIGRLEGNGNGQCLMFNGHMDTSNTGDEEFLTGIGYKPHAVVKDGMIYGLGIYNMKGALACYVHAVKALLEAGVKLQGDVILGAVCGEIEKTQWGEFEGKEYRGYGAGTHYLVNHGILPDMCILGEPTDMQVVLEHAGSMWVRFGLTGNYVHSAFAPGKEEQNAIRRMYHIVGEVMQWIPEWQEQARWAGRPGFVNIGCVRAGHPWRASRTPERADLFLDVRVPPTISMTDARRAVKKLYLTMKERHPEYGLEFETYVSVPGATIDENHAMVKAIERNHQYVVGKAAGARYGAVVFGCVGALAIWMSDGELWAFERAARPRGRKGRDQNAGGYNKGLCADRGGDMRKQALSIQHLAFGSRLSQR